MSKQFSFDYGVKGHHSRNDVIILLIIYQRMSAKKQNMGISLCLKIYVLILSYRNTSAHFAVTLLRFLFFVFSSYNLSPSDSVYFFPYNPSIYCIHFNIPVVLGNYDVAKRTYADGYWLNKVIECTNYALPVMSVCCKTVNRVCGFVC